MAKRTVSERFKEVARRAEEMKKKDKKETPVEKTSREWDEREAYLNRPGAGSKRKPDVHLPKEQTLEEFKESSQGQNYLRMRDRKRAAKADVHLPSPGVGAGSRIIRDDDEDKKKRRR